MTLGQFLSTPLASMRFGNDHSPVGGGTVQYAGQTFRTPGEDEMSGYGVTPPEVAAMTDQQRADSFAAAEAQGARDTASQAPARAVGARGVPLSAATYARNTFGGVRSTGYQDTTGSAAWDPHAASLQEMGFQAFGGSPNDTGTTSDEGQSRFTTPMTLDESGAFSQSARTAGNSAASQLYQAALKAVPMDSRGYTAQYVQKLNDWIAAAKGG